MDPDFVVKVNVVVIKGVNDHEIPDFVRLFCKDLPVHLRFIEYMPFNANQWNFKKLCSKKEMLESIERTVLAQDGEGLLQRLPGKKSDTSVQYHVPGWKGTVGIISSMTDQFCGGCNRMRLTSDGKMKNCLFGEDEWDLKRIMREAADPVSILKSKILGEPAEGSIALARAELVQEQQEQQERNLIREINRCIAAKHASLGGRKSMHDLSENSSKNRPMVSIGG